ASAVSIKPPVFNNALLARWFTILDSQFALANITVSSTKFHHAFSSLPMKVVNRFNDTIIREFSYKGVKNAVIKEYSRSAPELFDSLMSQNNVMCGKPSAYLSYLRNIATVNGLGVSQKFLGIKFIKGLPESIRPLIV
ncbi:hypothetical protein FHG87_018184, partial [Trinorchestia longiramus]